MVSENHMMITPPMQLSNNPMIHAPEIHRNIILKRVKVNQRDRGKGAVNPQELFVTNVKKRDI